MNSVPITTRSKKAKRQGLKLIPTISKILKKIYARITDDNDLIKTKFLIVGMLILIMAWVEGSM